MRGAWVGCLPDFWKGAPWSLNEARPAVGGGDTGLKRRQEMGKQRPLHRQLLEQRWEEGTGPRGAGLLLFRVWGNFEAGC